MNVGFIKLKDTVNGEYIRRNASTSKTYVRGGFVRGYDYLGRKLNKYSCIDCDDANHEVFIKGDTLVYVGFTY